MAKDFKFCLIYFCELGPQRYIWAILFCECDVEQTIFKSYIFAAKRFSGETSARNKEMK